MYKKHSLSAEEKIKYVQKYLDGNDSIRHISSSIGISAESFRQWIRNYTSMGIEAFTMVGNKRYSKELKLLAVKDYLSGLGSQDDICIRYGIRSKAKLQKWISMYNGHNELKSSGTGGITIMTKGRSTTYNERIEIVKYCIEHQNNYAESLFDKRGKRKLESEMSELEKLKAKNKLLEAENRRQQMEIEFLKKLDEIERRRF